MIRPPMEPRSPSPSETGDGQEADCRPQVALPRAGMPTWALGAMAVALGSVVLLALNAQRVDAGRSVVDGSYMPATLPPMPPTLGRLPGEALSGGRGALPVRSPFDRTETGDPETGAFTPPLIRWTATMRGGMPDPPAPFSASPMRRAGRSSEAEIGRVAFPTEPMPGGPGGGGGVSGPGRAAGSPGSSVVYDVGGRAASGGFGEDKAGGDGGAARASVIRNRPGVVAQGEILPATLETPVNSMRPGPIRALVSRDVRGFDGSRILIPRGSRLLGEYRSDPQASRRRVLVTWTRLIRPDGVAIRIDSPGADSIGGIGLPGKVDTHFLARFANAALQSALQIGVNLASRAGNGAVIVSNTPQLAGAMGQAIIPGADDPPTVSVQSGAAISVFVARDLDFSGVPVLR